MALIIEVLSKEDGLNTFLEMLFAGYQVIIAMMKEKLQEKIAILQECLEWNGMKISIKTIDIIVSGTKELVKETENFIKLIR